MLLDSSGQDAAEGAFFERVSGEVLEAIRSYPAFTLVIFQTGQFCRFVASLWLAFLSNHCSRGGSVRESGDFNLCNSQPGLDRTTNYGLIFHANF